MSRIDDWDIARTAFMAMDCQNDICHPDGAFTGPIAGQIGASNIWTAIRSCLDAARDRGLLVVHVRHVPDTRPVADGNESSRVLRGIQRSGALRPDTWGAQIVDEIPQSDGDLVLDKHRVSAFAGTDLDRTLRQRGIDNLLLSGVTTSFVVEGTARDAVDRGLRVCVVADGCVSLDQRSHRVSMEQVLPMLVTVTESAAIVAWLRAASMTATS